MSFTRSKYDSCETNKETVESRGPGNYMMNTPVICGNCLQTNPRIIAQKTGVSLNNAPQRFYYGPVDAESELRNINKPASRCPDRKYMPNTNGCSSDTGYPAGQGVITGAKKSTMRHPWTRCPDGNLIDQPLCHLNTEDCRLSNPPSTLRGTGWNRFNPLCIDPQKNVLFPGSSQVSTRLVIKDNHRPCVPTPHINSLDPNMKSTPCMKTQSVCSNPTAPGYRYDVCG